MELRKRKTTTLLYIVKGGRIVLAMKKRGFGVGKFNGVGGKVKPDETIEQAMIRETTEEIGVTPVRYKKLAVLLFDEVCDDGRCLEDTHVYVAEDFEGELSETEEMRPEWFDLNSIPFDRMFPDDKIWLPQILSGKKVRVKVVYDDDFNVLSFDLNEVQNLE